MKERGQVTMETFAAIMSPDAKWSSCSNKEKRAWAEAELKAMSLGLGVPHDVDVIWDRGRL